MRRPPAVLLACLVLLVAHAAAAQDMNDIPPPGELAGDQSTQLRVESPVDGEVVQAPFAITGVAAAGARLELWLDGELERKFIADASGRFSTPVPRVAETIELHRVDGRGERLASVGVAVSFGGAAAAREPGDRPVDEPDEVGEQGREKKVTGLPRVEELDQDVSSLTPIGAELAPEPAVEDQAPVRHRKTPSRGVRGVAEAGVGLATAVSTGFAGALIGGVIGLASNDPFAAIGGAAIGGLAGLVIGLPLGVVITGNAMDGNGKIWATIAGEVTGILIGGLITAAYSANNFDGTVPVFVMATFPTVGAVLGYELSSDPSARRAKEQTGAWRPVIRPTGDGGFALGLSATF